MQVSVFGVEGKYANPAGESTRFKLQHCFDFGASEKYVVRVYRTPPSGGSSLVEVLYQTRSSDEGRRLFEEEVNGMTDIMKSHGLQQTFKNILSTKQPRRQMNTRTR